jgi:hypothetical protein
VGHTVGDPTLRLDFLLGRQAAPLAELGTALATFNDGFVAQGSAYGNPMLDGATIDPKRFGYALIGVTLIAHSQGCRAFLFLRVRGELAGVGVKEVGHTAL